MTDTKAAGFSEMGIDRPQTITLICMLFGLTSQCFTGDTLESAEYGLCPIEEIQKGDDVRSENGTVINTTENHSFYVEGKGWCAATELEDGDVLRTQNWKTEMYFGRRTGKRRLLEKSG